MELVLALASGLAASSYTPLPRAPVSRLRGGRFSSPAASEGFEGAYDFSALATGGVFVCKDWLGDELLHALRADVRALLDEGAVPDTDEPIGKRAKLELRTADWSVPGEAQPSAARAAARRRFDALRLELERAVGRPLLLDALGSQAKYSIGKTGEPIHLHIDQKHEAFAGQAPELQDGAPNPTRRSLAWLLYLSDDGWDEEGGSGRGGVLHAYPRADALGKCGAHEGNLQVGWLERGDRSLAVYLDCWVVPEWMRGQTLATLREEYGAECADGADLWSSLFRVQPGYALYALCADGAREPLSAVHHATDDEGEPVSEAPSLAEMLHEGLRPHFSSVLATEHPRQCRVDVSPRGGTLVVFEASVVPHEVTPVVRGDRIALFGFFAESREVPAAWADPAGAASDCGPWFLDARAHTDC